MLVWRSGEEIPSRFESVVSIGIFDGVHRGHRRVLKRLIATARAAGLPAVALTFDPHPVSVHHPERGIELIQPLTDRIHAIHALGVDAVFVKEYTLALAALSPEEFVSQYFVQLLGARAVVVGQDVRFGRDNSGDLATLRRLGEKYGFAVVAVADVQDEDGQRWSSTWAREVLASGRVAEAARILGRDHRLRGVVEHGFKRGRQLGFPTANLSASGVGVVPADGVYAGYLVRQVPGTEAVESLPAAISVGTNPQFDGRVRTVEAHVLGRADLDLYGQQVAIDFVRQIRPMLRFESVEELQRQMDDDLRECALILGVPPTGRIDPALLRV